MNCLVLLCHGCILRALWSDEVFAKKWSCQPLLVSVQDVYTHIHILYSPFNPTLITEWDWRLESKPSHHALPPISSAGRIGAELAGISLMLPCGIQRSTLKSLFFSLLLCIFGCFYTHFYLWFFCGCKMSCENMFQRNSVMSYYGRSCHVFMLIKMILFLILICMHKGFCCPNWMAADGPQRVNTSKESLLSV